MTTHLHSHILSSPSGRIGRRYVIPSNPAQQLVGSFGFRLLVFLGAHVLLAFLVRSSSVFSTIHAGLTLALGLYFLMKDDQPFRLIYLLGYLVGAELIWRGTNARVFYETGKYAIVFLVFIGLFRYRKLLRADKRPLIYFVLLLPSLLLLPYFDREQIAFTLAGPLALAVAAMFFSTVSLNREQLKKLLLAVLAPTISLGVMAYLGILSVSEIEFVAASLRATSANIGPNQVSSILGLGALVAFLYVTLENTHKKIRFLIILAVIWLLSQTVLTFSRGGFWTTIGASVAAAVFLIRDRRTRNIFLMVSVLMVLVMNFLVYPSLERFTTGTLTARFSNFNPTGRFEIIRSDWVVFLEHPFLGVGPYQSKPYHALFYRASNAHTEYSRMLAEHGSFGVLALAIMVWLVIGRIIAKRPSESKAFVVAFLVWALLFMAHSATRLVAPSFLFGLAFADFNLTDAQQLENDSEI